MKTNEEDGTPVGLPTSPNEMPLSVHNDAHAVRELLMALAGFSCVDIHREIDHRASDACGEPVGDWEVMIDEGVKRFRGTHRYITNALWFATTLADASVTSAYEERQKVKAAALAKLTVEERRALGL